MFGKLFQQMYDGTLVTKGCWEALVTFQQLIILADKEGVVDMTAEAISRRTTIPIDVIEKGLKHLQEPDSGSRTPDLEGRRISLLDEHRDWGWQIVNHAKYRAIRTADDRRQYHREYWREKRSPSLNKKLNSTQQTQEDSTKSTNSNASASVSLKPKQSKKKPRTAMPENFAVSDRVVAWADEHGFGQLEAHLAAFRKKCEAHDYRYVDWDSAFMEAIRMNWAKIDPALSGPRKVRI